RLLPRGATMKLLTVSGAAFATAFVVSLAAQSGGRTTWDGVYSAAQATRGQAAYANKCAKCHGSEGVGGDAPELVGSGVAAGYNASSLNDLFMRIKGSMPADAVGSLSAQETVDILVNLLALNEFPAGNEELGATTAALSGVKYVAVKPAAALVEP